MDLALGFRAGWLSPGDARSGDLQVNALQPLLVATRNPGKLQELRQLLIDLPFDLYELERFPGVEGVPETGESFIENASLKAVGYATQTRLPTLADDSGLEVDALGGGPGVFSARYAGEHASDVERTTKLLAELSSVASSKRTARFVSAIVIASGGGQILNVSVGTCDGHIGFAPRGSGGFGYDPIFIPIGYERTFAELKLDVKNQISHRARALHGARAFLRSLTIASSDR
jgi:XTP/dITP diphosphohydrolase